MTILQELRLSRNFKYAIASNNNSNTEIVGNDINILTSAQLDVFAIRSVGGNSEIIDDNLIDMNRGIGKTNNNTGIYMQNSINNILIVMTLSQLPLPLK